jgi:hypothetical protein
MRNNELFLVNIATGEWNEQLKKFAAGRKKSHNLLNNSPLRSLYSAGELIVNCCKILFLLAHCVTNSLRSAKGDCESVPRLRRGLPQQFASLSVL